MSYNIGRGNREFIQILLSQKHLVVSIKYVYNILLEKGIIVNYAKRFPTANTGEEIGKRYSLIENSELSFLEDEFTFGGKELTSDELLYRYCTTIFMTIGRHNSRDCKYLKLCSGRENLRDLTSNIFDTLEDYIE